MPPKSDPKASEPKGAARFGRVKNSLKMGIVGLPNVGKSSLFNLLTEQVRFLVSHPLYIKSAMGRQRARRLIRL